MQVSFCTKAFNVLYSTIQLTTQIQTQHMHTGQSKVLMDNTVHVGAVCTVFLHLHIFFVGTKH